MHMMNKIGANTYVLCVAAERSSKRQSTASACCRGALTQLDVVASIHHNVLQLDIPAHHAQKVSGGVKKAHTFLQSRAQNVHFTQ